MAIAKVIRPSFELPWINALNLVAGGEWKTPTGSTAMKSLHRTVLQATLPVTTLLALLSLPFQVSAQGGSPPNGGPIPFSTFDADGDGEVDEAEFNRARGERMAANAAEGRPMKNAANMPTFEIIDTDGNGTLSETEILVFQTEQRSVMQGQGRGQGTNKGMNMASFSDIDTDGNGCISPDELAAHHKAMHPGQF